MAEALSFSTNYGEVIRRRLPLGLSVAAILAVLTIGVALTLPAVYKSRAVILIEQQDIPEDLVRSLVTSYADQRIQVISQRVLTSANLTAIINKFDLYPDERQTEPVEVVLEEMREDITVAPISADVVDQRSGRPTKATIAFELAFDSKEPRTAQRVANDLVSLFLSENLKQRTEAAEDTLGFLSTESERLEQTVADLERQLAEFKEKHSDALPELSGLNLQLMTRSQQDLVQIQNQIRSLEQQRVYLESELAQQEPNTAITLSETGQRIYGPADRLKALEAEFISLSARYGKRHPDVLSMKKEIDALREQVGASPPATALQARLEAIEGELAATREKYGEEHPDVRRLNREIVGLQREIAAAGTTAVQSRNEIEQAVVPDNPVYVQLKARLDATLADINSLRNQQAVLAERVANYEQRLAVAPQVEREHSALVRDYEIALAEYREVQAKRQEAVLARSLEEGQKGERFNLIEPPVVPQEADRPNRVAIGLAGLLFSLVGGFGAGAVADALDGRIYGRAGLVQLTGVPPLAIIPNLENSAGRRQRVQKRLKVIAAFILAVGVSAMIVHWLIGPLDVLFFRVLRVAGLS